MSKSMAPASDIAVLIEIMRSLRTPGTGCPWDLEQSFLTIAPYTLEEAYEVADAIARNNMTDLKEELGDLLLQVVYHAQMAGEIGAFHFGDVVEAITTKMIRRHPHVFGDEAARSAGIAKGFWESAKAQEKAAKAQEPSGSSTSQAGVLDDVPLALPALTRAVKLQTKAAAVGFDWPDLVHVMAKLKEELAEFDTALGSGVPSRAASDEIAEELGDILFVLANVARHLQIDPESALRSANEKFVRRFRHIEDALAARGSAPARSTLAEMDALWDEAKARERKR